ncbi:hypothetical protein ES707_21144 [subsurface metagenome]
MKDRLIWSIFWALVGVFIIAVCAMAIPAFGELVMGLLFIAIAGAVFLVLGGVLIFLTVRQKVGGLIKKFLLLTGASAVGIPVSVFLHNAVYGLFIYFFGEGFWSGGDEPFFFIMGVIVCPLGFLVGVVGNIVLVIRRRGIVSGVSSAST